MSFPAFLKFAHESWFADPTFNIEDFFRASFLHHLSSDSRQCLAVLDSMKTIELTQEESARLSARQSLSRAKSQVIRQSVGKIKNPQSLDDKAKAKQMLFLLNPKLYYDLKHNKKRK